MRVLCDYQGWPIRLTSEHPAHILEHREFVVIAYLTDRVKSGVLIWPKDH
jgi:hypothetical protein